MTAPTNGQEPHTPGRVLLVSVPRTASNLLLKVLNVHHQPNVLTNKTGGYFFHEAYTTATSELQKPFSEWTDAEKARIRDIYQRCLCNLEEYSARARSDGKVMFAKEHGFWLYNPDITTTTPAGSNNTPPPTTRLTFDAATYGAPDQQTFSRNNHTLFPDAYLRTWQLAFVIRHPALAWPSLYRAMLQMPAIGLLDEDGVRGASLANMSLASSRMLFDWGVENHGGAVPPVIDAHDIIHSPGAVLRFCEAVGMERAAVRFEWEEERSRLGEREEAGGEKEGETEGGEGETKTWDPAGQAAAKIMLSTLVASKGLVKGKAPAMVDIKAEAVKWREEFGEEVAGVIEKAVWDAMPDYEYMRERRVQA